jgi:hypothetical protein
MNVTQIYEAAVATETCKHSQMKEKAQYEQADPCQLSIAL